MPLQSNSDDSIRAQASRVATWSLLTYTQTHEGAWSHSLLLRHRATTPFQRQQKLLRKYAAIWRLSCFAPMQFPLALP